MVLISTFFRGEFFYSPILFVGGLIKYPKTREFIMLNLNWDTGRKYPDEC